jgi:HD-like signal output (HDOD) protein
MTAHHPVSFHDAEAALDRLVSRACQLYTLPGVAMQVLQLTSNPKVDTRALKECIETDPALTAKLLRVVNSSLFGLSRAVSDVSQALALLGIKPLKLLVLTFSLPHGLFHNVAAGTLDWYWRHTLTKAVAAREIGRLVASQSSDEAFTAALLQDLGVLLLIQEMGKPYIDVLDKVIVDGGDLAAAELQSMGFDHTELTARLLEHWRLPTVLIDAVRAGPPRTPRDAPSAPNAPAALGASAGKGDPAVRDAPAWEPSPIGRVVAMAGRIARLMADNQAEVYPQIVAAARQWRLLPDEAVDPFLQTLEQKVQQLAEVLSLKLPEGVDASSLIVRAHAQLTDVAAAAAEELIRAGWIGGSAAPTHVRLDPRSRSLHEAVMQLSRRPAGSAPASRETPDSIAATEAPATDPAIAPAAPGASAAAHRTTAGSAADRRRKTTRHAPAADPAFRGRLVAAVAACRQNRCALSLLLAEIVPGEDLVMRLGVRKFDQIRVVLERTCRELDHPQVHCLPYGEIGFSVILVDCERRQAVHLGNALIDRFPRLTADRNARESTALPLGVGTSTLSMPPKNFPPDDLLTAAEHCLYGSHASGGGVVKSIEIY